MERRKHHLLGSGGGNTLRTHGEGGTNTALTQDQVVATVTRWNQPGRLRNNYSESRESVQIRFDLVDGGRVAIIKPVNPYTQETLLVTAFGPNGPQKEITAEFIYDKSDSLQYKYWQATIAQTLAMQKQTPLETSSGSALIDTVKRRARQTLRKTEPPRHVFFMENTGPLSYIDDKHRRDDLGGLSPRTARTGSAIHMHVTAIHDHWLTPGMREIPQMDKETQILQHLLTNGKADIFITALSKAMQAKIGDPQMQMQFIQRTRFVLEEGTPTGYSLQLQNITEKNAMKNIAYIAKVMQAHFLAYQEVQQNLFGQDLQEAFIPQPSFRTYGTFEKQGNSKHGVLTVTISPQIYSYGGPLEAAGVELQRDPSFPTIGTEKQRQIHRRRLIRTTKKIMRDKKHEARRVEQFLEPEWP